MALSHQFIWSSTSLMLCFIFSGGRSLDWPTIAESQIKYSRSTFLFSANISRRNIFVFVKSTKAHGPQRCSLQKHPFLCFGSGTRAGWVAAPPSPSWRVPDQWAGQLLQEECPASLHRPWLSWAWWASPGQELRWQAYSVTALPWKDPTTTTKVNWWHDLEVRRPSYIQLVFCHYLLFNCDSFASY